MVQRGPCHGFPLLLALQLGLEARHRDTELVSGLTLKCVLDFRGDVTEDPLLQLLIDLAHEVFAEARVSQHHHVLLLLHTLGWCHQITPGVHIDCLRVGCLPYLLGQRWCHRLERIRRCARLGWSATSTLLSRLSHFGEDW